MADVLKSHFGTRKPAAIPDKPVVAVQNAATVELPTASFPIPYRGSMQHDVKRDEHALGSKPMEGAVRGQISRETRGHKSWFRRYSPAKEGIRIFQGLSGPPPPATPSPHAPAELCRDRVEAGRGTIQGTFLDTLRVLLILFAKPDPAFRLREAA